MQDSPGASEVVGLTSDDVQCLGVHWIAFELGRARGLLEPEQGDLDAGRHGGGQSPALGCEVR